MNRTTFGRALLTTVSATAVAGLTLTGCGSDNNAPATGTSAAGTGASVAAGGADCGGKNALTAEGSTAQQNAIAVFNQVWGQACPGKNLSYNPTGSGAGVTQFIAKQVDFAGSDSPLAKDQVDPRPPAAAATRRGTCRWCSVPSRWHTTSTASTSSSSNGDVLAKIFTGADHDSGTIRRSPR